MLPTVFLILMVASYFLIKQPKIVYHLQKCRIPYFSLLQPFVSESCRDRYDAVQLLDTIMQVFTDMRHEPVTPILPALV